MQLRSWQGPVALGVVALAGGCLVSDPRPPPGSITMTATSDRDLQQGFVTSDGWTINYRRYLASLGHASPEGDSCTFYSDAAYDRVLDLLQPGPQRLGIIYALGQCQLDFEVSSPWEDSVLGKGTTATDRDFMRTPGDDDDVMGSAISIYVDGTASKGPGRKRFAWAFRRRVDYTNCYFFENDSVVYGAQLGEKDRVTRDITLHGATLFQDNLDDTVARLAFGPFAAADDEYGDANGEVSLSELGLVPLSDLTTPDSYADGGSSLRTLEDYVYSGLLPRIARYQGEGWCEEVELFPNDRVLR